MEVLATTRSYLKFIAVPEIEAFRLLLLGDYLLVKEDANLSFIYASNEIKMRWKPGEQAIIKDHEIRQHYSANFGLIYDEKNKEFICA